MNQSTPASLTREQLRQKYPLTYPTLESWEKHVTGLKDDKALDHAAHVLKTGGGLKPVHHEFTFSDDYKKAWNALFAQAKKLGFQWDKHRKRFI